MLDALILDDRRWDDPPPAAVAKALCDGIRALGPEALRLEPRRSSPARAHRLRRRRGHVGRGIA
jgi:hypothetical protein